MSRRLSCGETPSVLSLLVWAVHRQLSGQPAPAVVPDPLALFSVASAGANWTFLATRARAFTENKPVCQSLSDLYGHHSCSQLTGLNKGHGQAQSQCGMRLCSARTIRKRGPLGAPDVAACCSGKVPKTEEMVNFQGLEKTQGGLPEEEGFDQRGAGALFSSLLLSCGPRRLRITNRSVKI